jgi:hypothetical protein
LWNLPCQPVVNAAARRAGDSRSSAREPPPDALKTGGPIGCRKKIARETFQRDQLVDADRNLVIETNSISERANLSEFVLTWGSIQCGC